MKLSNTWYALILIASALFLRAASPASALKPPKPEQNESLTKEKTTKAENDQASPNPAPAESHPKASSLIGEPTTKKEQKHTNNLRPEATAAEWIMVGITSAYVLVAFFTLLAIKGQADLAERALTQLERAWVLVFPKEFQIHDIRDGGAFIRQHANDPTLKDNPSHALDFRFTMANHGRSPAWICGGISKALKIRVANLPPVPDYSGNGTWAPTPMAQDTDRTELHRLCFSPKEFQAFLNGELDFVIVGLIKYRDVFAIEHETRYCLVCERRDGTTNMYFGAGDAYNRST